MKSKIIAMVFCSLALGLLILLPAARAQFVTDPSLVASEYELAPSETVGVEDGGGPAGQTPYAGTYEIEFELYTGTLYAIVQMHADGTLWSCDQSDFGLAGYSDLNSPLMGSWTRTGPRQATTARLCFCFDNPHVTMPTRVLRAEDVINWDVGWDTGSGFSIRRMYDLSAGEDPLDPEDGTPLDEAPWTMRRIVP